MKLVSHKISPSDKNNIELYLGFKIDDGISDAICKIELKGNCYYAFEFVNNTKTIGYQFFSFNFNSKIFCANNSFWSFKKDVILDVEYLILSDNPLSIIQYYSANAGFFKNKSVICFVPGTLTKSIYDTLISKYTIRDRITVFDNQRTREALKIKTLCFSKGENVAIHRFPDNFSIKYQNKELTLEAVSYSFFRKKMNIKTNIQHKLNP